MNPSPLQILLGPAGSRKTTRAAHLARIHLQAGHRVHVLHVTERLHDPWKALPLHPKLTFHDLPCFDPDPTLVQHHLHEAVQALSRQAKRGVLIVDDLITGIPDPNFWAPSFIQLLNDGHQVVITLNTRSRTLLHLSRDLQELLQDVARQTLVHDAHLTLCQPGVDTSEALPVDLSGLRVPEPFRAQLEA